MFFAFFAPGNPHIAKSAFEVARAGAAVGIGRARHHAAQVRAQFGELRQV